VRWQHIARHSVQRRRRAQRFELFLLSRQFFFFVLTVLFSQISSFFHGWVAIEQLLQSLTSGNVKLASLCEAADGRALSCALIAAGRIAVAQEQWDHALFECVSQRCSVTARALIGAGANVDALVLGGRWTPLIAAVGCEYNDMVELLLALGANANQRNGQGETPLYHCRSVDMVRVLVAAGADVDAPSFGRTRLFRAMQDGSAEWVEALLKLGADAKAVDECGRTLLSALAEWPSRNIAVARLLLAAGAPPRVESPDQDPLNRAIFTCADSLVAELLSAGAHVDASCAETLPPLTFAVGLAVHGPVNYQHRCARMPTLRAPVTSEAQCNIVTMLLLKGADVNSLADGEAPLHCAAASKVQEVLALLLAFGAKPWVRTTDGRSALQVAASAGLRDNAVLLVAAGASADGIDWGEFPPTEAELRAAKENIVAVGERLKAKALALLDYEAANENANKDDDTAAQQSKRAIDGSGSAMMARKKSRRDDSDSVSARDDNVTSQ